MGCCSCTRSVVRPGHDKHLSGEGARYSPGRSGGEVVDDHDVVVL